MTESMRQLFRREPGSKRPSRRAWYDPGTWSGAMALMTLFAAVLWIVEIVNASDDYALDRFGIKPRQVDGLWGVVTTPFLHASFDHMVSNTVPVILIGWVLMRSGVRTWGIVTAVVVLAGDLATWAVGPSDTVIVGASGMVFGWLGYLLARAYFARRVAWIVEAVLVLFFFGTLLYGLLPTLHSKISWQAHLCGFLAGLAAGAVMHPRGGKPGSAKTAAVS